MQCFNTAKKGTFIAKPMQETGEKLKKTVETPEEIVETLGEMVRKLGKHRGNHRGIITQKMKRSGFNNSACIQFPPKL